MLISGRNRFRKTGGGLRERDQGLLQEADRPAEQPHHLALGLPVQGRPAEDHDHLYHRRPLQVLEKVDELLAHKFKLKIQGRRRQADHAQDRVGPSLHVAVPVEAPVGRGPARLLRQHLRRRVQVLVRVPRQHPQARHHPPDRQMLHHSDPSTNPFMWGKN